MQQSVYTSDRQVVYPSWAVTKAKVTTEPMSDVTVILKYSGAGGSYFVQSIPDAVIINTDMSPVVHNPLRGAIWPHVADNRTSTILSWPLVRENVQDLVKLPQETRPRYVVLDTFDSLLAIIQADLAKKAKVESFADLPLRTWATAYSMFWDGFFWPLRYAGFPIILVVQLYTEPTASRKPGELMGTSYRENAPLIPEKLFTQLLTHSSLSAKIEISETFETNWEQDPNTGLRKMVEGGRRTCRKMVFYRENLVGLVKSRFPYPEELDITGPDPFTRAFLPMHNSVLVVQPHDSQSYTQKE